MRLGRWGRRHRSLVATAVAILATATVGLAAGLVAVNAEKDRTERARLAESEQRALAQAREKEARDKEAEARAVLGFVQDKILAAARPEGTGGWPGPRGDPPRGPGGGAAAGRVLIPGPAAGGGGGADDPGHLVLVPGRRRDGRAAVSDRPRRYTARLGPDHPDTLSSMNTSPSATTTWAGTPRR